MFGGLLQRLCSEGRLTIQQIADAWKIEPHSVYPYFNDRWPPLDRYLLLVERVAPDVQRELIAFVIRGCPRWVATRVDPALDVNGDGDINTDDAVSAAISSADQAMGLVKQTHASVGDRNLTVPEIDDLLKLRDDALSHLVQYGELLLYLRSQAARRRSRRTLTCASRARSLFEE